MANSGIIWIDLIFDWCVNALYQVASLIGVTYEEINVWLFLIIGPLISITSLGLNVFLLSKFKSQQLHSK